MAKKLSGSENFENYFKKVYQNRWPGLKASLLNNHSKIAFSPNLTDNNPDHLIPIKFLPRGFYLQKKPDLEAQLRQLKDNNLYRYYLLDLASAICALSLEINNGDRVLDMCAAPGGKSLILTRKINHTNELICNELSKKRKERLRTVINDYLSEDKRSQVKITGSDATTIGIRFSAQFDKVLLDAPCSGEKHLLKTPKELEKWSPKRTARLAAQQYAMLCSALLALKPGGQLVYSTCSISPKENEEVIAKFLKKKGEIIQLDTQNLEIPSMVEKRENGFYIFPDHSDGHGPIFFTRFKKLLS